jgi:hypothetical protein
MLTNQNQSITPFTYEGVSNQSNHQQPQSPGETPGVVENNRKRHFRSAANYSELATVTALNASLWFGLRLLQVAPAGYLAIAILNFSYYTITATNEKKPITHILTGLSASGAAVATLSEPIGDWVAEQSGVKKYYSEVDKLTPHNANNLIPVIAFAVTLLIGLTLLTGKNK